ncbi:MAG: aldo/keto reductase [Gammaproteobacteria bacterium]|nr:aldo/keto reductase [Gammaproteobacteria bacterium]
MIRRSLGSTGIMVSPLGLGTVKFGRNEGVKYPSSYKIPDLEFFKNFLAYAKAMGINTIDTAPAYGLSEERLGTLLKGQRQDWVIIDKAGEEFEKGKSTFHFDAYSIEKSVKRSLQRLQTDYIDVLLIHSDGNDLQIIQEYDVFNTLARLKQLGLIRAYGMSTKTLEGGIATVKAADVVMATYNPLHKGEEQVLELAQQMHKGVFIKKAFASGHLDKFGHQKPVPYIMQSIFEKLAVSSVITGTINPQHLKESVEAVNQIFKPLPH